MVAILPAQADAVLSFRPVSPRFSRDTRMSTKPDVAHAVPSPQCDIALPLSSEYHRGQLNEYLEETKRHHHDHRQDRHHQHHRQDHHRYHHTRDHHEPEKMSVARPSRGQDDGIGALQVEMKPRTETGAKPNREDSQTELIARSYINNEDVDMEEIKATSWRSVAASYPGAVDVAGKGKPNDDMEPNKATRYVATHHDAAFAMKTSALGLAALASTSVVHSTGTARASTAGGLDAVEEEKSEEKPSTRIGAIVFPGLLPRDASEHSVSTDVIINGGSSPPLAVQGEEQPLPAMIVADRVTLDSEEADLEAQRQAENIADMVRRQIFPNPSMVVVHTNEDKGDNRSESNQSKRICILLLTVLLIAGAIAAGVAIPLSHDDTTTDSTSQPTPPPSDIDAFRSILASVSEEGLYEPNSPQYKALDWIANKDPANMTVGIDGNETINQRYVAAVLYFALGGEENWIDKYNFLTEGPICSWNQNQTSGIICDSTNVGVVAWNMSKNGLRGSIPEEIGYFSNLGTIVMTESAITGTLPSSFAHLSHLAELNLIACKLVGTIPDFLYNHAQLEYLLLDDNSFTGTIPPSLGTSPKLTHFWVMSNKLTGTIPASVGQSSILWSVDLSGNSLTGTISEFSPSSQIQYLSLDNNTLYGSIPSSIGNLHLLQTIWLDSTSLEGTIPTELGQCQNLDYISFQFNQLKGDIGPVINTLPTSLTSLDLSENRFSGTVPAAIQMFTNLKYLDLGDNTLNGTIPTELGLLTDLEVLNLHSNRFTGSVPTSLANLTLLKSLFLNDNDLTGSLDALCGTDFEVFAANPCEQVLIECKCCNACCDGVHCNEL